MRSRLVLNEEILRVAHEHGDMQVVPRRSGREPGPGGEALQEVDPSMHPAMLRSRRPPRMP